MEDSILHTKYRPKTLDDLIGHDQAVTQLRGMLKAGNPKSAFLFAGPPSVGKTTLARALAGSINGRPVEEQLSDYKELNAADSRTIEDVRELIRISKFKPQSKRRIIVIDEAQSLVTNKTAADALLKPLEDSGTTSTIWILCTMDPAKFQTGTTGPAIAKRCTQILLKRHPEEALMAQAKRIVKGEGFKFLYSSALLEKIVKRSDFDMRNVASLIGSVADYYAGLKKKPEKLDIDTLTEVLEASEAQDEKHVVDIVVGCMTGSFTKVQTAILSIDDHFMAIKKLMWVAQFLLNVAVLPRGSKHPSLKWFGANRAAFEQLKKVELSLGQYAAFNEVMVHISQQAASFTVGADNLMSAYLFRFIKDSIAPSKKK